MALDLHIHSIYSDGSDAPDEIVRLAAAKKLKAISVTDHDTMDGTAETQRAGELNGIEVITGLELSSVHGGKYLHILGYGMRPEDPELRKGLARLQCAREERNQHIIDKLAALGIPLEMEEVRAVSRIGQTGRPHIAKALMHRGVVHSTAEAFEKFLKKGAVAYVSRFVYDAKEAIGMIRKAGGIAVLAHPAQIDPTLQCLPRLVAELVGIGLEGVELYYPKQSASIRKKIQRVADRYRLLCTGGSDYHGDIRPGTHLAGGKNVYVPLTVLEPIRQRLMQINR